MTDIDIATLDRALLWRVTPGMMAYTLTQGKWTFPNHLQVLDREVVRAIISPNPRVIIEMPPQSGKTVYAAVWTPTWLFDRRPDYRIIYMTYSGERASFVGGMTRDNIVQYGPPVHKPRSGKPPTGTGHLNVQVRDDSTARDFFQTTAGGYQLSTGIISGSLGYGADCLIVDDPVANRDQVRTHEQRDKLWQQYLDIGASRLKDEFSPQIVIMHRWHEDDIAGRLREAGERSGNPWRVITMPAVIEDALDQEHDELHRQIGQVLWPEVKSATFIQQQRDIIWRDPEAGAEAWWSLWQQRPQSLTGAVFTADLFRGITVREDQVPDSIVWVNAWDTASDVKTANDFSAGATVGFGPDGVFYIRFINRGKWPMPDLRAEMKRAFRDKSIRAHAVERDARGIALYQELVKEPHTLTGVTFFTVKIGGRDGIQGDKFAKLQPWLNHLTHGKVRLVEGPWNRAFIEECLRFAPNPDRKQHDDQLDAVSVGWWLLRHRSLPSAIPRVQSVVAKSHYPQWLDRHRAAQAQKERAIIDGSYRELPADVAS